VDDPIVRSDAQPVLVAIAGGVASGKSSLARALAQRLGFACIVCDEVRDSLLEVPGDSLHEAHWWRGFAAGFEDQVYAELLRRAEEYLVDGRAVVLDACFPRNSQRLAARSLARRRGVPLLFVECRAREETVRARLAARDAESGTTGWQTIHDDLAAHWEPVAGVNDDENVVVTTDGDVADAVSAVVEAPLLRRLAAASRPDAESAPRPSAVTFDCWNTLLYEEDWEIAHALRVEELRAATREAGDEVSHREAARAFDAAWDRHMRGWAEGFETGAGEVARWGLAELGLDIPNPAFERLVAKFEEASHSSRVRAVEGARELLSTLGRAGIPSALVCDTGLTPGRVVRRHLDRQGLLTGLAAQSFSDEVGAPKPDPRVFRAALEPLGIPPERALHVGDLRRTDVAGARNLGMRSVRIRSHHDDCSELPEADHIVDSHAELEKLLGLANQAATEADD
jgi:putative hydrolase of the HAD superfamily